MAAKQTRRSISIKGLTYQRIQKFVAANGGTISGFVEDTIQENMGEPTDEDRKKFGEAMKEREKETEAKKAEETDEPQIQETPEPEPEPDPEPEQQPSKRALSKGTPVPIKLVEPDVEPDEPDELEDYTPPIQFF